jgi:TolB-like protein/DNA-binding winged helix-turn-helix (wHTH) protein
MPVATYRICFGPFELNSHTGELYKCGQRLRVSGKPVQVLVILLNQPGELIAREDLRKQLWPADTFVDFENGLNTAVKKLRQMLGDEADSPKYIETLPRRGYRFIGEINQQQAQTVTGIGNDEAVEGVVSESCRAVDRPLEKHESTWWKDNRLRIALTVATLAVSLILAFNFGLLNDSLLNKLRPPRIHSLAVLPLSNLSGDPKQEYFADGMTEELTTELSRISGLKVASRTSTLRYKDGRQSAPQIGRDLKVDALLEGSVLQSGNRVRVTANLVTTGDEHIWGQVYDRDLRDVLSLHRELARDIAEQIQISLTPAEKGHLSTVRPVDPESHEAYLRGRYHATKFTREPLLKARDYLEQAIDKDPTYAPAYAELSHVYFKLAVASSPEQSMSSSVETRDLLTRVRFAAQRAVELDPSLPQAHTMLGIISIYGDFRIADGRKELERAVVMAPESADALIHASLWRALTGESNEGKISAEHALEVDPLSVEVAILAGQVYFRVRDYDGAIEQLRKALELDAAQPRAYISLSRAYEAKGMHDEAIRSYQKALELKGAPTQEVSAPWIAYSKGGIRGFWLWQLQKLAAQGEGYAPTEQARLHALLGDREGAIRLLEKAYQQRDYTVYTANVAYEFDPMRSDYRFNDLLRRLQSPQ